MKDNVIKVQPTATITFRPRARILRSVGHELASDPAIAVVELVKNAYDADANNVSVCFVGRNPNDPDKLVISDDGTGMSVDDFEEGWLQPGTERKARCRRTPLGRIYLGGKGIGRFAAASIADTLTLKSKTNSNSTGLFARIDWGIFDEDKFLDEVDIDYQVGSLPDLDHGTKLELSNIHSRKHC